MYCSLSACRADQNQQNLLHRWLTKPASRAKQVQIGCLKERGIIGRESRKLKAGTLTKNVSLKQGIHVSLSSLRQARNCAKILVTTSSRAKFRRQETQCLKDLEQRRRRQTDLVCEQSVSVYQEQNIFQETVFRKLQSTSTIDNNLMTPAKASPAQGLSDTVKNNSKGECCSRQVSSPATNSSSIHVKVSPIHCQQATAQKAPLIGKERLATQLSGTRTVKNKEQLAVYNSFTSPKMEEQFFPVNETGYSQLVPEERTRLCLRAINIHDKETIVSMSLSGSAAVTGSRLLQCALIEESVILQQSVKQHFIELVRSEQIHPPGSSLQLVVEKHLGLVVSIKEIPMRAFQTVNDELRFYGEIDRLGMSSKVLSLYQMYLDQGNFLLVKEPFEQTLQTYLLIYREAHQIFGVESLTTILDSLKQLIESLQTAGYNLQRNIAQDDIVRAQGEWKLHNFDMFTKAEPKISLKDTLEALVKEMVHVKM